MAGEVFASQIWCKKDTKEFYKVNDVLFDHDGSEVVRTTHIGISCGCEGNQFLKKEFLAGFSLFK